MGEKKKSAIKYKHKDAHKAKLTDDVNIWDSSISGIKMQCTEYVISEIL